MNSPSSFCNLTLISLAPLETDNDGLTTREHPWYIPYALYARFDSSIQIHELCERAILQFVSVRTICPTSRKMILL
jgi:hypothetical protein